MNIEILNYYTFRFFYNREGLAGTIIHSPPHEEIFGYCNAFNNIDILNNIILELKGISIGQTKEIGCGEEAYLRASFETVKIIITLPISNNSLILGREKLLSVLTEYSEWLSLYESCKLPGIIPESKLNSWVCVPKEYVNDEWWDKKDSDKA